MKIIEIILISLSLAMDAFSVSICKGLQINKDVRKNAFNLSLSFSLFQMLMPIIGFFIGNSLNKYFLSFNHIIAFVLLIIIGLNMLIESYKEIDLKKDLSFKELIGLSIATSIDALSVGITFSLFKVNLLLTIIIIGFITFLLSFLGFVIGKKIGHRFEKYSQIMGGIILIIMGIKFLFS